jgi:deazaflavin-dependent oxidoreductase (nitroreductase family)
MARQYRLGVIRRLVNRIVTGRVRAGKSVGGDVRLLTTVGRKTGLQRTNPVTIVEVGGAEWLVAPYGPVAWVHNLRAAGTATLATDGDPVEFRAVEADAATAAPVLKHYITEVKVVRPFFDVAPDAPLDAFTAVAPGKPVFRIES